MWFWLSCVLAGLSLCCLVWVLIRPAGQARPAPGYIRSLRLRLAWPWIHVLAIAVAPLLSWRIRRAFERLVQQAGLDPFWRPEHVVALQLICALIGAALLSVGVLAWGLQEGRFFIPVAGACFMAWLPWYRLSSKGSQRRLLMQREFPFLLDMATLCVEAGLSLQGALQQAAHHGPPGPLREELRHSLGDMRAGVVRHEALQQLARRTGVPAVQQWVIALIQAEQLGVGLGPLLRAQSEQRRNERFLRAEKLALEAPVKMLFPLVCCIFPCTFLIIGFPIAVKLLEAM